MKAEVLQETTFAKDIDGNPLVVGEVAELDPALGNQWECLGIVRITDHGTTQALACTPIGAPNEHGHVYRNDPELGRVRDYQAERAMRRRQARQEQAEALKTKKKGTPKDDAEQEGTSGTVD